MNTVTVELTPSEIIEVLTALRLAADRYMQHGQAAEERGNMVSAEQWLSNAHVVNGIYGKCTRADKITIHTLTD